MTAEESRALDQDVATKVLGLDLHWSADYQAWFLVRRRGPWGVECGDVLPNYSSDIADAWKVHLKVLDRPFSRRATYFRALQEQASESTFGTVMWPDVLVALRGRMPEAICRAALKAVEDNPNG